VAAGTAAGQTLMTALLGAERDTVHRGIVEKGNAESVVAWRGLVLISAGLTELVLVSPWVVAENSPVPFDAIISNAQ
jgi:hypothetical protein